MYTKQGYNRSLNIEIYKKTNTQQKKAMTINRKNYTQSEDVTLTESLDSIIKKQAVDENSEDILLTKNHNK